MRKKTPQIPGQYSNQNPQNTGMISHSQDNLSIPGEIINNKNEQISALQSDIKNLTENSNPINDLNTSSLRAKSTREEVDQSSCEFIYVDDDSSDSLIDEKVEIYRNEKHETASVHKDPSQKVFAKVNSPMNIFKNTDVDKKIELNFKKDQWKNQEDNFGKENLLKQLQDSGIVQSSLLSNINLQKHEENNNLMISSNNNKSRKSNDMSGISAISSISNQIPQLSRGGSIMHSQDERQQQQQNSQDNLLHKLTQQSLGMSLQDTVDIWQNQLQLNTSSMKHSLMRGSTRNPLDITQREQQILQKKKNHCEFNNNISGLCENHDDQYQQQIFSITPDELQQQHQQQYQLSPVITRKIPQINKTSSNDQSFQSPCFNNIFSPSKNNSNYSFNSEFTSPQISIQVKPFIRKGGQLTQSPKIQHYNLPNNPTILLSTKPSPSPNRNKFNLNSQTNPQSPLSQSKLSIRQWTIPTPQNKSIGKKIHQVINPSPLRSIISQKQKNPKNQQMSIKPTIHLFKPTGSSFIQFKEERFQKEQKNLKQQQFQVGFQSAPTATTEDKSERRSNTCHKMGYSCHVASQKSDSEYLNQRFLSNTESTKSYSISTQTQGNTMCQSNQPFQICPLSSNVHNANQQNILKAYHNNSSYSTPKSSSICKESTKNPFVFANGIQPFSEKTYENNGFNSSPQQKNINNRSNSNYNSNKQQQFQLNSESTSSGKFKVHSFLAPALSNSSSSNHRSLGVEHRCRSQISNSNDKRITVISSRKNSKLQNNNEYINTKNCIGYAQHSTLSPKSTEYQPQQQLYQDQQFSGIGMLPQISGLDQQTYHNEDYSTLDLPMTVSQCNTSYRTSRQRDTRHCIETSHTLEPQQTRNTEGEESSIRKWPQNHQKSKRKDNIRTQLNQSRFPRQLIGQSLTPTNSKKLNFIKQSSQSPAGSSEHKQIPVISVQTTQKLVRTAQIYLQPQKQQQIHIQHGFSSPPQK